MGPAPLPPHERNWRHPSELAPSIADVDGPTGGRGLILATGAAAALLAVVMVVALTPPRSSAPNAVGATTIPSATIRLQNSTPQTAPRTAPETTGQTKAFAAEATQVGANGTVRIDRNTISRDSSLTLVGAPNAVSAASSADSDDMAVASRLPDDDDRIIVLTFSHTYDIEWGQIERIEAPDGSIVMTRDGDLLATFVDGELRLLVS